MFSKGSRSFLPQQPNEIRKKGKMYKTPKAEVTGSNPVGCATIHQEFQTNGIQRRLEQKCSA